MKIGQVDLPKVQGLREAVAVLLSYLTDPELLLSDDFLTLVVPLAEVDPVQHADALADGFYWSNRDRSFEILGSGTTLSWSAEPDSLSESFGAIDAFLQGSEGEHYVFGGLRFDQQAAVSEQWLGFGSHRFVWPKIELRKTATQAQIRLNLAKSDTAAEVSAQLRRLLEPRCSSQDALTTPSSLRIQVREVDWCEAVEQALFQIDNEALRKVVLARQDVVQVSQPDAASDVLRRLHQKTTDTYLFMLKLDPQTAFVGASPESLYAREERRVYSEAQAGTRPRGLDAVQDEALASELLNSNKDAHEHDLVHEDILSKMKQLCLDCGVVDEKRIVKLQNVQHLCTRYGGILHPNVRDLDLISLLHPTPAVCGYPKEAALSLIRKLEPFDRGYYAGPIGVLSKDHAEFAVAIRSAMLSGDQLLVYAGAGIVLGSNAQDEWDEITCKMRPMLHL